MKLFHKNINYFSSNAKIIIAKIIFFSLLNFLLFIFLLKNFSITKSENKFIQSQNKYFIKPNSLDYFKLFDIRYLFSFKFKIIKVEYNIEFYENNNNSILPSDLTLYKNLHIFCHFESINSNIIIKVKT